MPKKDKYTLAIRELVRVEIYRLDWIKILKNAINARPTSWNPNPINEWRNASDEVLGAFISAAEDARIFQTLAQRVGAREYELMPKDEEDVLFFAFRYALGRRTGAVDLICTQLKSRWQELRPQTQEQIKDEIRRFPEQYGSLGGQCDIDDWNEILSLPTSKRL